VTLPAGVDPEIAWSLIVGGIVAFARMIIWLIGLVVAIRGSRSKDRAAVLRAYSTVHDSQRLAGLIRTRERPGVRTNELPGRNDASR
jgi:hypothetical protein